MFNNPFIFVRINKITRFFAFHLMRLLSQQFKPIYMHSKSCPLTMSWEKKNIYNNLGFQEIIKPCESPIAWSHACVFVVVGDSVCPLPMWIFRPTLLRERENNKEQKESCPVLSDLHCAVRLLLSWLSEDHLQRPLGCLSIHLSLITPCRQVSGSCKAPRTCCVTAGWPSVSCVSRTRH